VCDSTDMGSRPAWQDPRAVCFVEQFQNKDDMKAQFKIGSTYRFLTS
jgi:hypothetical protein